MTFLVNPLALTVDGFRDFVATKKWPHWRPSHLCWHNTGEPDLTQWRHFGLGHAAAVQRARNLNHYYAHQMGWHSGPHLFIAPDLIIVACDLEADGVHASCFNHVSIGIEMVGHYDVEDFENGDGNKVQQNSLAASAILSRALGLKPESLLFHRECLRDRKTCPGARIDKPTMVKRLAAAIDHEAVYAVSHAA